MPFPNKDTQFKPGQSGNPAGKPLGTKHLSTWIQDLLTDEEFTVENAGFTGKTYKGAPIKAIIMVAINNSLQGDNKWADWLGKYGYGQKYEVDQNISGELKTGIDPIAAAEYAAFLKGKK